VLLHGAFQDSTCWERILPQLKEKGHQVLAVELPGRGRDGTPIAKISLELYRDRVLDALRSLSEPAVLVGHSFGGMSISNAAEAEPLKIKRLVYLSAYLPQSGQSLQDLSQSDEGSLLATPGNFVLSQDFQYASIREQAAAEIFANDADPEDRALILKSLIREPLAPLATPLSLSPERFGGVRKLYVMTLRDRCVSPVLQEKMTVQARVDQIFRLDAGHASYVTQPDALARLIEEAAR
jgi:pimeloyl-ACP methyl ester carboxylesterase